MEERDCPDQILLGAMDPDFCVILALACHLETKFTMAIHSPRFLFGERDDEDEPNRINGAYRRALKKCWNDPEFRRLLAQVRGGVGSHSLRKFPATWAAEHACSDPEVEIRGRWKGKKNGRIVNKYISVEQLPTDAKVAAVLCVGGPVKYKLKPGSNVTTLFLTETVAPGIDAYFTDESNKISEVLAKALLWACHEPSLEHMVSDTVRNRVRAGYNLIRGEHPADYNPVEKVHLQVYRIENTVHIDELVGPSDTAESNDAGLNAAQAQQAHREQMTAVLLQLHRINQRQGELATQLEGGFSGLRLHFGQELSIVNKNVHRIAVTPGRRITPGTTANAAGAPRAAEGNLIVELSPTPRSLYALWTEYTQGIGNRKPAKDFTPSQRGRVRHTYSRRKIVWDCIAKHVNAGYTVETAIGRILQCYGYNQSVTNIIKAMKRDKKDGGHPNLRLQPNRRVQEV